MQPADVDDLMGRKFDVCFGHADGNGDGVLEDADGVVVMARVVAYLGESFSSPKATALFTTGEDYVNGITEGFDIDGDGVISPEEWRKGLGRLATNPDAFKGTSQAFAEALFAICDRDGDGRVDPAEFAGFHKAFGMSPHQSQIAFDKLDRDGNGWLSVDELVAAWVEYYTSSDPDAPGNWLYGDIWDAEIWDGTKVKL